MPEDEYKGLKERLDDVAATEDREDKIHQIAEEIEKYLYLLGLCAVKDRLQDNAPQVIQDWLLANIKLGMLTGDKLEAAENIAYSCRLITGEMHVMRCFGKTPETEELLVSMVLHCESVVVCRVSPKQKAEMVCL